MHKEDTNKQRIKEITIKTFQKVQFEFDEMLEKTLKSMHIENFDACVRGEEIAEALTTVILYRLAHWHNPLYSEKAQKIVQSMIGDKLK